MWRESLASSLNFMLHIWNEWLGFLIRWIHLIAGISWIGNSFYFMWLDSSFEPLEKEKVGVDGELYMVHGGHFYHVEKQKFRPGFIPKTLHWFKWEATFTWLSGFVLLTVLYYFTDGIYLLNPESPIKTPTQATLVSLGLIFGSWFVYDFFWQTKLAEKNKSLATGLSLIAVCVLTYLLCLVFTGRGAFLHLGAIFATLMVLNVWIRILPGQTKMFEDAKAGKTPDYTSGTKAKWRSTHNSYLTLPVLFSMISNHFPLTYGHSQNWILLIILCVVGGTFRHMMIQWNKGKSGVAFLIPISILIFVAAWMTAPKTENVSARTNVRFSEVKAVMARRCLTCHSQHPTDPAFVAAPNGLIFEDPTVIKSFASKIKERVVVLKNMPLANRSEITDEERALLGNWVDSGASTDE